MNFLATKESLKDSTDIHIFSNNGRTPWGDGLSCRAPIGDKRFRDNGDNRGQWACLSRLPSLRTMRHMLWHGWGRRGRKRSRRRLGKGARRGQEEHWRLWIEAQLHIGSTRWVSSVVSGGPGVHQTVAAVCECQCESEWGSQGPTDRTAGGHMVPALFTGVNHRATRFRLRLTLSSRCSCHLPCLASS